MTRHDVLRVTLLALLASLLSVPLRAQEPPWIFGMHDPGAEGEMEARGKRGFIVFTEAIGIDPNDRSGKDYRPWSSRGHGVIVRLNNGYGGSGTLPRESQYPAFAQRVANFIQNSPGADIWIVGNETNLSREWPGNVNADPSTGEAITPARYVNCYNQVYAELQRRGLTNEILVPAPTGTWAPPYDGSLSYLPNRGVPGFLDYWTQVLNALGPTKVRGLAIHTYTHGSDPNLITSTQKMGWPYQDVFYHFLVYRNFMARIPTAFRALPVWITESNQTRDQPGYNWDPDSRSIQWIANAYAEINSWNSTPGNQKIHTLALFRWPDVWEGDRNYCVSCVGSAVEGFRQVLTRDYRWTTQNPPPAGNDADIDRTQSTVPSSVPPTGGDVVLRVRNTGGTTWSAGAGYRLGTTSTNQFHLEGFGCGGYSNSPTDGRVFLCSDVAPGQTVELRFRIRPSVSSGVARLSLRMVRDGVQWFGDTETWDVNVSTPSGCGNTDFSVPSDRYKLEIWNNRTLSGEPVERRTDFVGAGGLEQNWGTGKASNCTGNDNFSIRFSRRFQLSTAGTYRFTTTTDDGVRLYIDGGLLIDQWKDQAPTSYQATRSLTAGWHDLRMDYYENGGGAYAKLDWLLITPSGGNDADIDRTQSAVPSSVPPTGSDVVLRVRNTGGTTWSAGAGYRLGATSTNQFHFEGFACGGYSNSPTNARVFLCNDVPPGQTAEFRFRIRPSVSSGVAKLSLRMVRDGVQWFGDTETWDVTVSSAPPPTVNRVARIGFHVGPAGNQRGLGDWMRKLDTAGIPFFLKSIDSGGQLLEAARLREVSGVPHVLVFRATGDVPNYDLPPEQAAREHWVFHKSRFPPELIPYKQWIWVETVNEIDKNRAEWLGRFAYETSLLAMNDGFRWAAFGWSSGEPEPEHWEGPEMLRFLRLASENPDQIAIALHEYSFTIDRIDEGFPWLVGRFQRLFDVADRYGLERPTVVITEWGWEYQRVPDPATAMEHIRWADELYEPHPQILGAAIWYLGPGFGGISDLAQKLIAPVTDYYLQKYGTTSVSTTRPVLP